MHIYSLNFGHSYAFKAQVLAVEYGIELAWKMGIKKLQIQLDNQAVVLILKGQDEYRLRDA